MVQKFAIRKLFGLWLVWKYDRRFESHRSHFATIATDRMKDPDCDLTSNYGLFLIARQPFKLKLHRVCATPRSPIFRTHRLPASISHLIP